MRVLLIEDDPISMRILSTVCNREGVDYAEAIDGFQAVALFVSFSPHLVLTDMGLCVRRSLSALIASDPVKTV